MFLLQAGLERLPQLYGHKSLIELLRQDQRRTGCERPGPGGPFRPSRCVDTYDFRQVFLIEGVVVRRFMYFGDLEAGLEGRLEQRVGRQARAGAAEPDAGRSSKQRIRRNTTGSFTAACPSLFTD